MHGYLHVIPRLRWQDGLDVLIVAYVIYRIALLIRGTRTMQMVVGLGILAAAFVTSQMLGLFTLNWLLNNFLGSLIVILVVIFQADIRRALTGVGARSFFTTRPAVSDIAEELVKSAEWLSARRIGGLIVVENDVGLQDVVDTGRVIEGRVSPELIETIFMPGSPMHDGAVIIKGDQVLAAACQLPLSTNPNVSLTLGMRHRAAIGLTEDSDASVIVVSEQDGTISVAQRGRITRGLKPQDLLLTLQNLESGNTITSEVA
ncbi:MAG TPA: diadenylate cyclase CdaA [Candidatus Binataceae bacterium]|nr:diadenylate cyclase CdaA [Candidatus Binataceae bacterium]